MHACGHDMHMTNMVGVARYLASHRDEWSGTLVVIGQPAEETQGRGPRRCSTTDCSRRFPRPDFAVALHVGSDLPPGKIEYRAGYAQANVDSVDITIKGRGGHGAAPDTTIDPIVIAARLVLDLQTIVSREIKPIDPAVITVGSIHGGSKHNIIGDDCKLQLTVRSYTPEVREKLLDAIRRKALGRGGELRGAGAGGRSLRRHAGAVQRSGADRARRGNDQASARRRERGRSEALDGRRGLQPVWPGRRADLHVSAWARSTRRGSTSSKEKGESPPSLHSPLYYPNAEASLRVSVPVMVAVAIDLLAAAESGGPSGE